MALRKRSLFGAFLTAAGLTVAAFFWLLFAITDCSAGCVARGERAVPLILVGLGLGLVVSGFLFPRSTSRAVSVGFLVAGISAAGGIAWIVASEGSRGMALWLLAAALALAGIGAWMRFAVGRDGGRP